MIKRLFPRPGPSEPLQMVPESLTEVLKVSTPRAVALWLNAADHDHMDEQVSELTRDQSVQLTELLTPHSARELLESITPYTAVGFLSELPVPVAAGLVDSLEADDATRIIELMDDDEKAAILRAMEVSHSALVRGLLAWPEDSAASRMRPEFLHVGIDSRVEHAVAAAREEPDDLDEGVFVTEEGTGGQRVLGWLSPNSMVIARRADPVEQHMISADRIRQWAVSPLADQERVAHRIRARESEVVAVMDGPNILGVITKETINDILAEEGTEDAERQGGSAPLDVPYLQASPFKLWSKRIGWLLVLFVAEMYTGNVMKAFEGEIEKIAALAFFIPLLIGTGGNVGTQITTTLVRAMALEGVRMRDMFRIIWKEMRTGVLVAVVMGAAGLVRAWTLGVMWPLMLTVAISLAAIVLWSALMASGLPLILKSVGVDPAVVSGPMIATLVDGTGLLIYFLIAKQLIVGL